MHRLTPCAAPLEAHADGAPTLGTTRGTACGRPRARRWTTTTSSPGTVGADANLWVAVGNPPRTITPLTCGDGTFSTIHSPYCYYREAKIRTTQKKNARATS